MTEVYEQKPSKTSGLAIVSLNLGVIGFLTGGITAVVGLILGIISIVQIGKDKSVIGQKTAVAGVVVSSIAIICMLLIFIFGSPVFNKAKDTPRATICMNNVKKINMGVIMYSNDNNDTLPASEKWVEAISTYVPDKKVLRCPTASIHRNSGSTCYAMNSKLNKIDIKNIKSPVDTAMIFESIPGNDPNGGKELLPFPGRHYGENNIGFADGHVEAMHDEDLASVKWGPAGKW
jgi:prepilin-type processing-associated H-X9-DG protein